MNVDLKFGEKILMSICVVSVLCDLTLPTSRASTLSAEKQRMHQLQEQSNQTAQDIAQSKQQSHAIQKKITGYQSVIEDLNTKIATNQRQLRTIQQRLNTLNQQMRQNQLTLQRDQQALNDMFRALYESGAVPYIAVVFQATSWDDFLNRFESIKSVTKAEDDLVKQVVALHKTLDAERAAQNASYKELRNKAAELTSLQSMDKSLQVQQKKQLTEVKKRIRSQTGRQLNLQSEMHLTQSQIAALEQQVQQADAVLSTTVAGVSVPELRYRNIAPEVLYSYVHARNSTFTLSDIRVVCQAAQSFDVNPALLVAITGQEEAFVPPSPDANRIRNNPFNVFYSWQVYNTNLADSAHIAADTLRHKLSVAPPPGEDAVLWINDSRNPWGIYATDQQWAYGVRSLFNSIMQFASTG